MSTLKAANIQSTTTGAPTFKTSAGTEIGQLIKAWVNFRVTSGTPSIKDDFNVTSITDEAAGDYTVNFTNAMANANYCVSIAAKLNGGSAAIPIPHYNGTSGGHATGSFRFQLSEATSYSTTRDSDDVCFLAIGN
tara:strand:+ start:41 stop:445 length:405 start_codon:yes stop_codon:yes gene_type:complete